MPDWTYHPLSPIASSVFGERRTRVWAMKVLAVLVTRAGGRRWIPRVFDHPPIPPRWEGRFGATVPPSIAREAVAVLPVQGASVVEIGPVDADDVEAVRRASADRRCRVTAVASTPQVAEAVAPYVDAVSLSGDTAVVRLTESSIDTAVRALSDPAAMVLATPQVLIAAGPGWFNRVIEAGTATEPPKTLRDIGFDPRGWPAWVWGVLVGLGLIVAGVGAAAIALGPVLLWYDRDYLGLSVGDLNGINHHLVGFLQHDRITMAGNMIGIGTLYLGLASGGIREGHRWARNALLMSGLIAFLTYFYFVVTGFLEPLHTLVVVVLFPMLLLAVWRAPSVVHWPPIVEGPESQRRRALWGQLLMIGVGGGLFVAGAVISTVGLTSVFVPTDLDFLGTSFEALHAADEHLPSFIAHDRAGFGGALMGAGLAVLLISLWGWRRGERWVWWSLLAGCAFGTAPVLAIHFAIGYTHFEHLLPVYVLVVVTVAALALSRAYLTAAPGQSPRINR
ncbi:hypothetical protein BST43_04245 [Mycobacteroides saopaulense]|uniref:Uncharacterized protein n=1 Tax=Mycobacteroides saopaulense TaxID=1578165 RepID=A0A1X0JC46_9MYCO|nr:hypothetical protein [Mycobacteroides saopaulense]ORB60260.1 hypothetical protein BST43_04245 [Mycobacteroides saopaulense]